MGRLDGLWEVWAFGMIFSEIFERFWAILDDIFEIMIPDYDTDQICWCLIMCYSGWRWVWDCMIFWCCEKWFRWWYFEKNECKSCYREKYWFYWVCGIFRDIFWIFNVSILRWKTDGSRMFTGFLRYGVRYWFFGEILLDKSLKCLILLGLRDFELVCRWIN